VLSGDLKSSLKLTTTNVFLVGNAFVWYLLVFKTLRILTDNIGLSTLSPMSLLVFGVNAISLALLAFVGSFVVDKFKNRTNFLSLWMLAGVFISFVPFVLDLSSLSSILIISGVFGSYFGIGMPAVMGYFSAHTSTESRAKVSGFTFLFIGLLFSILGAFIISNIVVACLVLSVIRLFGFLFFRGINLKVQANREMQKVSYVSILSNKSFILYFISWCMLSLVNYMTVPIQNALFNSSGTYDFLIYILENIIIAITAVVCGFVADTFGRKRLTIVGFIMLGIGYAILGLFPHLLLAGYFYVISDGIAWGIFNIVFLLIIWGDLAQTKNSDKLYFLGALPYVFSSFLRMLFAFYVPDISQIPIFSFASVFLFLAVLPLIYVPETLSEKTMKDRDLKSYVENAKKKVQKESGKSHKKEKPQKTPAEETQETEKSAEYDEAVKLAEKYY
jgi:MFS family permease